MFHMFYEVVDDTEHPTSWWLGNVACRGKVLAFGDLRNGRRFAITEQFSVDLRRRGAPTAFSLTLRDVPVVTTQVADLVDRMAPGAVQRFPVDVGGIRGRYEVLNVVRVIDAIDRERSSYILWKPEDDRPDKLGQFRQMLPLVIRDDIRQDVGIFRPAGWTVVLIVSAQLKTALEKVGNLGVLFRPLEGGFSAN